MNYQKKTLDELYDIRKDLNKKQFNAVDNTEYNEYIKNLQDIEEAIYERLRFRRYGELVSR